MKIGIDIGRVIIGGEGTDSSFLGVNEYRALQAPAIDGAFSAITHLTRQAEGNVWLVSKCGPKIQARTRKWLNQHRFFAETDVPPEHLRFCLRRPEKALHTQQLGLTHFIDDRMDVLEALSGIVKHRFLFGPQPEWPEIDPTTRLIVSFMYPTRSGIIPVLDWQAVLRRIL